MSIYKIKYTKQVASGDIAEGDTISTATEVQKTMDGYVLTTYKTYYTKNDDPNEFELKRATSKESTTIDDKEGSKIFEDLNKLNFENLKNNYFTDKGPQRYSSWVVEYNDDFKIVGTFDQEIEEAKKLKELLEKLVKKVNK